MHVFLETQRLLLRRLTEADGENLFELDSDAEVMRFLNGSTPTPRKVIEEEILPGFLRYYDRFEGYGFWAAVAKASGEFLGWFCFRPGEGASPGEIELGYRLRRAAWGRGYATEGARALIRKGFTELGVQRVVASTFEANVASRRVMEKAGLRLVRTYSITSPDLLGGETYRVTSPVLFDGEDVEYALEKAEWEQQRAAGIEEEEAQP